VKVTTIKTTAANQSSPCRLQQEFNTACGFRNLFDFLTRDFGLTLMKPVLHSASSYTELWVVVHIKSTYCSSKASISRLGPTHLPIQWMPGLLPQGKEASCFKLTHHMYPVSRLRMNIAIPLLPPYTYGVYGLPLPLLFMKCLYASEFLGFRSGTVNR
jgi:hypothetical protein